MAANRSALELLDGLIAELTVSVNQAAVPAAKPKKAEASKKSEAPAAPAAPSGAKDALTVNAIDLRVGRIVKVERHPTAEKLYVEEIDVGEETPRAIASGLVPYYSLEQMQNRSLIVVCNLKPRNLVGFKSYGMVLCAAKKDETGQEVVEFVDPPADSKPGDRVVGLAANGDVLPGEILTPSQVDKQKAFETIAANLRVDSEGIARWQDSRLVNLSNKADCTVPTVRDGPLR